MFVVEAIYEQGANNLKPILCPKARFYLLVLEICFNNINAFGVENKRYLKKGGATFYKKK